MSPTRRRYLRGGQGLSLIRNFAATPCRRSRPRHVRGDNWSVRRPQVDAIQTWLDSRTCRSATAWGSFAIPRSISASSCLWLDQGRSCPICQQMVTKSSGWCLYHLDQTIDGGKDTISNSAMLHPDCHRIARALGLSVVKPASAMGL